MNPALQKQPLWTGKFTRPRSDLEFGLIPVLVISITSYLLNYSVVVSLLAPHFFQF